MTAPAKNKLRAWRIASGKKVNDLAAEIGCTRQTWHSWESGANIPSPEFMPKLRELTDGAVKADDFYPSERAAA
jgi:transcriptional regulator with XRE-family HTH domain